MNEILLPEALLLLALDDERGAVLPQARIALDFGLAGALLMELALRGALRNEGGKLSIHGDQAMPAEPLLAETCRMLHEKPGKDARYWVHHLPRGLHGLRQRLLDGLVAKGTLQRKERRVMLVFPVQRYPERDPGVEGDLRQHLDNVLLRDETPQPRIGMLVALAESCRLLQALYGRADRSRVKKRVKALGQMPIADDVGAATQSAISAAAIAATMVAITAATAASTAAACSAGSTHC